MARCLGATAVVVLCRQVLVANANQRREPIPGDGDDLVCRLAKVTGLLGCHEEALSS